MGKEKRHSGVRARNGSIQIDFRYNGERCRETIAIGPTSTNLKNASHLRGEILHKIALGHFNYAEYFPSSPKAKAHQVERVAKTFADYAELYLNSLDLEAGT